MLKADFRVNINLELGLKFGIICNVKIGVCGMHNATERPHKYSESVTCTLFANTLKSNLA